MHYVSASRSILRSLFTLLLAAAATTSAHGESVFSLSDLTDTQRTELFTQIDAYGLATAMLNYCQRPPNLVAQIAPIAEGCVDPTSFTIIVDRFTAAVVDNSGRYNCNGAEPERLKEIESKIAHSISQLKTACRLRSFYGVSFPKFDRP